MRTLNDSDRPVYVCVCVCVSVLQLCYLQQLWEVSNLRLVLFPGCYMFAAPAKSEFLLKQIPVNMVKREESKNRSF